MMDCVAEFPVGGPAQIDRSMRPSITPQPPTYHGLAQPIARAEVERVCLAIMAGRRARYAMFDQQLFADLAWDILLVLTIAECRQLRVTTTQLSERVDAPSTTALRWIANMTDDGLLVRRDDMTDKRRKFVELSPDALHKMVQYCTARAEPHLMAA